MTEDEVKFRAAAHEMQIAATLTGASVSATTHSIKYVVQRYREVLAEIRATGGVARDSDGKGATL